MIIKSIVRKLLVFLFLILLFGQLFVSESKAGPFGRCGAMVMATAEGFDDAYFDCIYHFFRCDCARIKESY
jgi:hypothetical protein